MSWKTQFICSAMYRTQEVLGDRTTGNAKGEVLCRHVTCILYITFNSFIQLCFILKGMVHIASERRFGFLLSWLFQYNLGIVFGSLVEFHINNSGQVQTEVNNLL
uniref:MSP domain-containing protein n=1 Tax=Parascaris univalens TaxID=6257 RepID=A0A914ZL61_PARUN